MIGLAALVLVVVIVHPQPPQLADGSAAPPIVLQTEAGVADDVLASAAHHPVVVEFFATTCPTCRVAAASLCQLQASFPDVRVVAVDAAREPAMLLRAFRQQFETHGCAVPLLVDPGASVSHSYEISVVPTVYVIDKNGKIVAGGVGEGAIDALPQALQRLSGG